MTIEAVLYGDPVLRAPSMFINEINGEVREIRDLMVETLESYGTHGAAIAANQVGFALAMFVYWDLDTHEPVTVINPNLDVHHDRGKFDYNEGCLSLPGVYAGVIRQNHVILTGQDLDGKHMRVEATEFLGRVFQHEYDHLQGKLFIDKLPPGKKKDAALARLRTHA
jgi:peptide deformylase